MPKRGIDFCVDIMDRLKANGWAGREIPEATLRFTIESVVAFDAEVVDKYIGFLEKFNMVKRLENGNFMADFNEAYMYR